MGIAVTERPPWVVGVIFPLMRSKNFLHHPVYISIFQIEYNRGSSYHRAFYAPISFCSFLPLNIANHKKQGNAAVLPHHDIALPTIQTHARSIPRYRYAVWVVILKNLGYATGTAL